VNDRLRNTVNRTRNVVSLQISIREYGQIIILDLQGRSTIDGGESKLLDSQLQELIGSGARKVLLNLTNLTQVDSTGVGVIVKTYVSLRDQGGALKLLCPCGRVLEVLKVTRLVEVIPSFEDETLALSSFRPLSRFAWP
jgi:anti-sigma B factor antagonist